MYKPIQKRLLVHNVLYKELEERGFDGDKFKEGVEVKFVRVEPRDRYRTLGTDDIISANTLIFIDCFYTKPRNIVEKIKVGDIIVHGEKSLEVKEVQELFDDQRLHHLEVWCI